MNWLMCTKWLLPSFMIDDVLQARLVDSVDPVDLNEFSASSGD
jgi:hypothetical protein